MSSERMSLRGIAEAIQKIIILSTLPTKRLSIVLERKKNLFYVIAFLLTSHFSPISLTINFSLDILVLMKGNTGSHRLEA